MDSSQDPFRSKVFCARIPGSLEEKHLLQTLPREEAEQHLP
jgi:hypothetical protein